MSRRGNGEGSIYFQASRERYAGVVTLGDGTRKVFYGKTRQEAAEKLQVAIGDVRRGLPLPDQRVTLAAFLERWLQESVKPSLRGRTYESYETRVRVHIVPKLGKVRLAQLGPAHIQKLQNDLLAAGKAPRTVLGIRNLLSGALDQALKWGMIPRNPVQLVDAPRAPDQERVPMTVEQAGLLLDTVRGDRLEALYTVALALGLRRGEALGLRWSDIDFDDRALHVRRNLQRVGGKLQLLELKTRKSRRSIALPDVAVDALRAHEERQKFERRSPLWHETGLVFTSTIGTPIEPPSIGRRFARHLQAAGLPHQRFHDLRHACATLLLVQGVDLKVVQEILGHSSYNTTANIYAHVLPTLKRDAADRMGALLSRPRAV